MRRFSPVRICTIALILAPGCGAHIRNGDPADGATAPDPDADHASVQNNFSTRLKESLVRRIDQRSAFDEFGVIETFLASGSAAGDCYICKTNPGSRSVVRLCFRFSRGNWHLVDGQLLEGGAAAKWLELPPSIDDVPGWSRVDDAWWRSYDQRLAELQASELP